VAVTNCDVPIGQPEDYSFRRNIAKVKAKGGRPLVKQIRIFNSVHRCFPNRGDYVNKKNTLSALACQRVPYDVTLVGRLFEESTIALAGTRSGALSHVARQQPRVLKEVGFDLTVRLP